MEINKNEPNRDMTDKEKILILDPSDKFRPGKKEELFHVYTSNSAYYDRVHRTYQLMHTNQTYQFVRSKLDDFNADTTKREMTVMEALECLDHLVDESDPDCDVPNSVHAFQTAERIRQIYPDQEWFHLTGLIHDIGKVMACFGEPQWAVVGDTFPVGCEFSDSCVFGQESFKHNPDYNDTRYNTRLGVYEEGCGLDNVLMSWGHDEYLYRVLRKHEACTLPEEAFYIIRFHSFYPWHTEGDYDYLCNNKDREMLKWIKVFNKFDLYSKADDTPAMDVLKPYYQGLIDKYVPGKIKL